MRHNYLRKFVFSILVFLMGLLVLFFMVWGLKITEPQPVGVYITMGVVIDLLLSCLVYVLLLLEEDRVTFMDMSIHDSLTGLENYISFNECLEHFVSGDNPYGIFYIDVNCFRKINEKYGYQTGNEVLKEVAARIRYASRYRVFRLGGDQFAILVTDFQRKEVYDEIEDRLMTMFSEPFHVKDLALSISVSVGFAICPYDTEEQNVLRRLADQRMYKKKLMMYEKLEEQEEQEV